jgi:putative pre-16S rRNA nuclease
VSWLAARIKLNAEGWVSNVEGIEPDRPLRYLALDVGNRRVGVAVSDELGLTAQPVLTLERKRNPRDDLRSLARLCRRFGVAGIVVGNPLTLEGQAGPQAGKVQAFAAELGALTGLPIHLWDERLTTHEAHQRLYEAGRPRQAHRRVVDQVAAAMILQEFLERQGTEGLRDQD